MQEGQKDGRQKPKVSVIVPSYNHARYLPECIDSILHQDFQDFELIIIDDCSTDNSLEVLQRYEDNPKIRIIYHTQNMGERRSANEGIKLASGSYIHLVGSDDVCLPNLLAAESRILDVNPNVGLVHAGFYYIDANGNLKGEHRLVHSICLQDNALYVHLSRDHISEGLAEFRRLVLGQYLGPSIAYLMRRECYEQLGGYDEHFPRAGDWDMMLRIALRYDIAYIAQPLSCCRQHGKNVSIELAGSPSHFSELYRIINNSFSNLPKSAGDLSSLNKQAIQRVSLRLVSKIGQEHSLGHISLCRQLGLLGIRYDHSLLINMRFNLLFSTSFLGERASSFLWRGKRTLNRLLKGFKK